MGLAEQFANLGEELIGSFDGRVNFIGENIVDTHRFLTNFRKDHKAMGKKLRADLGTFVDDLSGAVKGLRRKFQKEQKAVHQECTTNHQAWEKVAKTMAAKRRNFKAALTGAKQKAARAH